jgi:hypothetical protein
MKKYQALIDQAIRHIRDQQSPDGSFENLSSTAINDFSGALRRRTTFFTANILSCLSNVPGQTGDIQRAGIKFLFEQRSPQWSYNYWARDAKERSTIPYPDDLDDTFAALTALALHNTTFIDGHAFAAIAKMLTAQEIRVGGPYRTWLIKDDTASKAWQDTDLVVNSTIGYFLSLVGVQLPHLKNFIDEAVKDGRLGSPYYPGIFHAGYFASRFYKSYDKAADDATSAKLADMLAARLTKNNGDDMNILERAMGVSSLVNLKGRDEIPPAIVDRLAEQVERYGFYPYAFCIDPSRGSKRCYAGASALTAAFCAQALAQHSASADISPLRTTPTTHAHIQSIALAACRGIGTDLRATAAGQIEKASDDRISQLAYELREALCKNGVIVPHDIAESLSLANLYGWTAYTIYDDALDRESDGSRLLPCANFFLRALTEIYISLETRISGIRSLFDQTMNHIDDANAWEQSHCQLSGKALPSFGDYHTLADRSIGHAMGPLAELLYAGYSPASEEYKNTELFFRHYLIARQLHDDAHDWADDLLRGQVNSVGTLILARFYEAHPERDGATQISIAGILPELQKIFWVEIVDRVAGAIASHIADARKAREKSLVLTDTDLMENALQKLESGARRAVKERDEVLIFLNDYKASRSPGIPF